MAEQVQYSAADLARWGLLEAVQREAARDRLLASIAPPSAAVLQVLQRQQADQLSRDLGDQEALLARSWRWQQWCEQQLAPQVSSHFLARKAGLDQVCFWRLQTADPDLAAELYQRLREGESSFAQLASQGDGAWLVAWIGPVALEQLPADWAGLLRVSEVGGLWAPRASAEGGWQVLQLERRLPAVLDPPMRALLLAELGEQALLMSVRAS